MFWGFRDFNETFQYIYRGWDICTIIVSLNIPLKGYGNLNNVYCSGLNELSDFMKII